MFWIEMTGRVLCTGPMVTVKLGLMHGSDYFVTPANAGVQGLILLDSGLRRNDGSGLVIG